MGIITLILVVSAVYPNIGPDGGYYLSIARDFYQDKTGIYEMVCGYNPLAILTLGFPYCLTDSNPYQCSVILLLIIHLINAYLFYRILRKLDVPFLNRQLFTSFFLLYSLLLDGTFIVLEPVQVLFLLSATLFLLDDKYFLSGTIVFLAFYSKQYSIAFLAGFILYVILDNSGIRKKLLNVFTFTAGFGLVLILFYFLLAKNIKFPEYLSNLTGTDIISAQKIKNITGEGYDFKVFLKTLTWVVLIAPVMFLWIPYLKDIRLNRITVILLGNILGFSVIFLIASYFHYFILLFPWCLILTAILISGAVRKPGIIFTRILFSLAFISISLFTCKNLKNRIIIYRQEMELKEEIASIIPPGSKAFLYGASPAQYIYSSLKSANPEEIGYMFPNLRELNYYLEKMDEKSLILLSAERISQFENISNFKFMAKSVHYAVFRKE